jgi:hypothetical protein
MQIGMKANLVVRRMLVTTIRALCNSNCQLVARTYYSSVLLISERTS